jgi:hypothetical protein
MRRAFESEGATPGLNGEFDGRFVAPDVFEGKWHDWPKTYPVFAKRGPLKERMRSHDIAFTVISEPIVDGERLSVHIDGERPVTLDEDSCRLLFAESEKSVLTGIKIRKLAGSPNLFLIEWTDDMRLGLTPGNVSARYLVAAEGQADRILLKGTQLIAHNHLAGHSTGEYEITYRGNVLTLVNSTEEYWQQSETDEQEQKYNTETFQAEFLLRRYAIQSGAAQLIGAERRFRKIRQDMRDEDRPDIYALFEDSPWQIEEIPPEEARERYPAIEP